MLPTKAELKINDQAQLEMSRLEVRDLRAKRLLDQASLAGAESHCSRLSAALSIAEDDMKTLQAALEQETHRANAWMVNRATEIN